MDIIRPDQFLTLALFLALLGALWFYVHRNRGGLAGRFAQGKRLRVAEVTALSPTDRAMILQVDQREFLLLRLRGAAPMLTELSPAPAASVATPTAAAVAEVQA